MRGDELLDMLGGIDAELVKAADRERKKRKRRYGWFAAAACLCVALAILLHSALPKNAPVPGPVNKAYALEVAAYPEAPNLVEYFSKQDALWQDHSEGRIDYETLVQRLAELDVEYAHALSEAQTYEKRVRPMRGAGKGLEAFFTDSAAEVLNGAGEENRVYSPLNTYLALAMLAELTDGESRAQILSLLGQDSIDALRTRANRIWNANYRDDGFSKCIPAGSVWLNESYPLKEAPLKTLADSYYSSSFQGEMGSRDYLKCMRGWLSEATGGMLDEQAGDLTMEPNDALLLLTTLFYEAAWGEEFLAENNEQGVFHAPGGDVPAEYMFRSEYGFYYYGERFSAVEKILVDSSRMWFILPDEGVGMDELLADEEYRKFVRITMQPNVSWNQSRNVTVNLRLPKFDVSSGMDLAGTLRAMGVTDCFDPERSDFTPLSDETLWVGRVQHDARLTVDEQGVRAAAYTAASLKAEAEPPEEEVDFTLDRPFIFLLVSADSVPLFTGVVNQPQQ